MVILAAMVLYRQQYANAASVIASAAKQTRVPRRIFGARPWVASLRSQ
jgi:hypothetical protein